MGSEPGPHGKMPGINGFELARQARVMRPNINGAHCS